MNFLKSLASLDRTAFFAMNVDGGPFLDRAALVLSDVGFGIVWGLVLAIAILFRLRRGALRAVVALGLAVAVSDFIGDRFLRSAFDRVRPCYALERGTFRQILQASNQGSFPSLHASNLFALATAATLADRELGRFAFPVAIAVSWSRVYGGVHWPADVLAGALWGCLAALFARAATEMRRSRATRA